MNRTTGPSKVVKPWRVLAATAFTLTALGAVGCFGNPRDFHPGQGQGQGGAYGGQGGYTTGGGQGGAMTACSSSATTTFSVQWTLENKARQTMNCTAVGATTMDLDVLNVATSAVSHDTFACDTFAGQSAVLAPGSYSVAMRLRDAAGTLLSEAIAPGTFTISAGCSTDLGLVPFEAVVTTPDQFITLTWAVERVVTGAPLTCADAHATTVELDAGTTAFRWPCSNGKGATGSLAPGSQDVAIKLLDATGTVLSLTPTMPVAIVAGQPTALTGTVTFDVN
jgi:hypothetical protein